jgi:hypothetical protein
MAVKKGKKKVNPPRLCIFCGGTPISKEHVFAEWMHPYLPDTKDPRKKGRHVLSATRRSFDGKVSFVEPSSGQLDRPGDLKSKSLKIVCESCNNRWMSVLQKVAKPVLLPFILGKWVKMNPAEQRILAAWITMFTMVAEKTNEGIETITKAQRKTFKDQKEARTPPNNWLIWIFSHHDEENPLSFWIRTVGAKEHVPQTTPGINEYEFGACISLFSLNKIGVLVISTVDSDVFASVTSDIKALTKLIGLRLVWPISAILGSPKKPTRTLAVGGARDFVESAADILRRGIFKHRKTPK